MNLPFTMPVEEAAECVKAFKPKVVIPFHYRGSDTAAFKTALSATPEVEVRLRDFYVGGETK
jgi:L-ascorbate metabolism protein UlaG (beta-lactamase superfamily)